MHEDSDGGRRGDRVWQARFHVFPSECVIMSGIVPKVPDSRHRATCILFAMNIPPYFALATIGWAAPYGLPWSRWLEQVSWLSLLWGVVLMLITITISLLGIGVLLVRLPETYFLDSHRREFWSDHHPVWRLLGIVLKNLLGVALIVLGAVLSLPGVPGQGLLTILVGLILLDIPGKRKLERAIIGRPALLRRVNALRARFGRPPLQVHREQAPTPQAQADSHPPDAGRKPTSHKPTSHKPTSHKPTSRKPKGNAETGDEQPHPE